MLYPLSYGGGDGGHTLPPTPPAPSGRLTGRSCGEPGADAPTRGGTAVRHDD